MYRIAWVVALLSIGCGTPPAKTGSNNTTSNNTTSNNTPNNTTSNNTTSNNTSNNGTIPPTGHDIWARDYDQSCEYDGDCAVVHEGDACLCGGAACGNTGIRSTDYTQWLADREQLCPPEMQMCSAAPCQELLPVCATGTCGSRTPLNIDASEWDASCAVDGDCMIVHEGEVCSSCVCGGTAVNVSNAAEYQSLIGSVDCTPGPNFCDCATIETAWCNDGLCEPGIAP